MEFLIGIMVILLAFAESGATTVYRKCVRIRFKSYEMELLLKNIENPYQLAIDHDTNTLFFSYTARTDEMFKSAYLSLKTGRYGIVRGIRGGFANAVDTNTIYMGGEDGIYTFDYLTRAAANTHIKDDVNVWQMFYKDGLYFTTYPDETAYFYKANEVVEVPALQDIKVMLIAVTNEKDLLYFNSSGIFLYRRKDDIYSFISNATINGISADMNGNIYLSGPSGIYYFDDETKEIEHLARINDVYGIAIEADGRIIYASEKSIIRLNEAEGHCGAVLDVVQKEFEIDVGKYA